MALHEMMQMEIIVVILNRTRAAQAAVFGSVRFSVVAQWMGLAHYARLYQRIVRDAG